MNVTRKDATITNTDEEFPGSFEVILSSPTEDRDGETLLPEDWKQPLPDHITFDTDHGMSVASTVGSGVPSIDRPTGNLVVSGTYSSLPRAQEARTLVREGHIRTTSVAFMKSKTTKDGKQRVQRELLNGAFVAIPSNRESLVLSAKSVDEKAGRRNSATDLALIQQAHDALAAAGAECMTDDGDDGGIQVNEAAGAETKAKYSAEQLRAMLAQGEAFRNPAGEPSYPIGDLADLDNAIQAVGRGGADHDAIRAYIIRRAKALGATDKIPDGWNADGSMKSVTEETTSTAAKTAEADALDIARMRANALRLVAEAAS